MTQWQWKVVQALIRLALHTHTVQLYGSGQRIQEGDIELLQKALERDSGSEFEVSYEGEWKK